MTQPQQPAELARAAQTVFLRRGFAAASVDEVAEEAGCGRDEVEKSFAGKYELFLAAFAERFRERMDGYGEAIFAHEDIEDSYRALARFWREGTERDPEWSRILIELLLHGSRDRAVGAPMQAQRAMGMKGLATVFDRLAAKHGIEYTRSTVEIALASGALGRGLAIEQLLDPDLSGELIEETFVAYMRGLTKRS